MNENIIFYFSGTGNSLQVANDIKIQLDNCDIKKITTYGSEPITAKRVGIVFPVYMLGIPLIIAEFLDKIQISQESYLFAVATYGGMPGKALDQVEDILEKREISLDAGFYVQMPGNYIVLYGAKSMEEQKAMFAKEALKIKKIVPLIKKEEKCEIEKSKMLIDRILHPIFYSQINKFPTRDKNFYITEECNGCGICAMRCPVKNIKMESNHPKWQHHCQLCVACIQACPKEAIQYGEKTKKRKRYLNPNV